MVSRLELYNIALRHCGIGRLARLEEDRDDRRELDAVYDHCLDLMLEKGAWNFALRTVEITEDTDIDVSFGGKHAFPLPEDYKRMAGISAGSSILVEDRDYEIENGILYSNSTVLYMRYVSNGVTYGMDLGKYPAHYSQAVGCLMAREAGLPVSKDRGDNADLFTKFEKMLREAKTYDAIDDRVKVAPPGRLVQARSHRGGYRQRINDTNGNF